MTRMVREAARQTHNGFSFLNYQRVGVRPSGASFSADGE